MGEALNVEKIDPRGKKEGVSPVEELTQLVLDPQEPDRVVSIHSLLEPGLLVELTRFLQQIQDVFA